MTTTAQNLINDVNPANTQIVEATVGGDGISAVSLRNDGTFILGNASHKGSINSDNFKFATDGNGNVTAQNVTAQGTLTVTGNTTFNGNVSGSGVHKATYFSGTMSTTTQTFNHNFPGTPTWIGIMSANLATDYFLRGTITSTTVSITANRTGASFIGIAIG